MAASKAPVGPFWSGRSVKRGGGRCSVAQHDRARPEILVGKDRDWHRPPDLSDVHRVVHERLLGRELVVGAEAGDRFVERRLDLGIGEPGAEPHLGLDLERLVKVLDGLVALLEAAEGHDPQRHVRARPDRMQHEARPLRDLERLVEELHRRLELEMLVGVDGLAIEQSDLADRRAVAIFRLNGPRKQHRNEGAGDQPTRTARRRLLPTACCDERRFARFNNNAERHAKDSPETCCLRRLKRRVSYLTRAGPRGRT